MIVGFEKFLLLIFRSQQIRDLQIPEAGEYLSKLLRTGIPARFYFVHPNRQKNDYGIIPRINPSPRSIRRWNGFIKRQEIVYLEIDI
jgi:hypothetical protein